ncbi:MAG: ATP synthase subunit I [Caldilineaceae bacterium]|nr:ATP synthase subunit I [Caldilineaceae bacterium]
MTITGEWTGSLDWQSLLPPLMVGIALGLFYFVGLWWTVQRLASAENPALFSLISLFVRNGIALLGFYLVTADRWERLVACLIGFVLARMALVQFLKPERDNTSSPKTQKNADPRSHTNPNPRNPCPIFRKAPDQSWKSPPTTSFFGNGDRCA